jgi:hypothetical protein
MWRKTKGMTQRKQKFIDSFVDEGTEKTTLRLKLISFSSPSPFLRSDNFSFYLSMNDDE